jgi:hypothetical protein
MLFFSSDLIAQNAVETGSKDIKLLSVKVSDVVLTYSVGGNVSKRWLIKVFVQNCGLKTERQVGIGLSAWKGDTISLPGDKRFIAKSGESIFQKKEIAVLVPGKCTAVNFEILSPKSVSRLLLGAWADCGEVTADLTVADVVSGKATGLIAETENEKNNYLEKDAVY